MSEETRDPVSRPQVNEILKSLSIEDLLRRGLLEDIIVKDDLIRALATNNKLTIYQGYDPTSSSLHLGHYLSLRILRWFQLQGHKVIFLMGDFTAQIGDPSGQTLERKQLSQESVLENTLFWENQISKILDLQGDNPIEIAYNSTWLNKMDLSDFIKLSSQITVQRLIERDMFKKRIQDQKPLHYHETLYPLLQGYDSVAMKVDIELGGRDQLFNMMVGRDFVRSHLNKTKHVLLTPLIPGLDGRKMSKTYGNTVDLTEIPSEMFFKLTQINDELLPLFFNVFTDKPEKDINIIRNKLSRGENLQSARADFAYEVVQVFHGTADANIAREEFDRVINQGKPRTQLQAMKLPSGKDGTLLDILMSSDLLESRGEARRIINQGGVEIDDKKYLDPNETINFSTIHGSTLKIGKRGYLKIVKSKTD